jgi:glycosyltransferase involved in cell wall biosynthesis
LTVTQKLLYISWAIPPKAGGSTYLVQQLAKNFKPEEILIAGGSRKPFLHVKEYDGINYHYFFTELNWYGHGDRYFAFFRWMLFPFFLCNLLLLVRKEKPDRILATFPDGYYLCAAWLVSRLCRIKLYSYFHNTYPENRRGFSKWFATKIQHQVFLNSKIIFLVSEGMQGFYKTNYTEFSTKFKVLPHTFEKYPEHQNPVPFSKRLPPYKLVMIGTFNHSNIEATKRLLNLISKYPSLYQVEIYTSTKLQIIKYKWGLDLDELGVHYKGYVEEHEVNSAISNCDACLITHGFSGGYSAEEYKTIFPTRTIPLLLSGRPLLVHSPEHSFLNKFIRKYDCAELVSDTSEEHILNALKKVTTDQERILQLIENAKKASAYFYGPDVYRTLISQMNADNL